MKKKFFTFLVALLVMGTVGSQMGSIAYAGPNDPPPQIIAPVQHTMEVPM